MAARSKRCNQQWGEHYAHCQQSIRLAMDACSTHQTALIFGAGSLNDVPLASLSEQFERVLLVDLLFLKSARKKIQPYPNIQLIEADVTESIQTVYQGQITPNKPQRWLDDASISLVVSLNLITQLPLLPAKWLIKQGGYEDGEIESLSKLMIQQHVDYLSAFNGQACLIADRWDTEFDRNGKVVDEFDPWWEIKQPQTLTEWDWELVPIGEGKPGLSQKNRVGVSLLNV